MIFGSWRQQELTPLKHWSSLADSHWHVLHLARHLHGKHCLVMLRVEGLVQHLNRTHFTGGVHGELPRIFWRRNIAQVAKLLWLGKFIQPSFCGHQTLWRLLPRRAESFAPKINAVMEGVTACHPNAIDICEVTWIKSLWLNPWVNGRQPLPFLAPVAGAILVCVKYLCIFVSNIEQSINKAKWIQYCVMFRFYSVSSDHSKMAGRFAPRFHLIDPSSHCRWLALSCLPHVVSSAPWKGFLKRGMEATPNQEIIRASILCFSCYM